MLMTPETKIRIKPDVFSKAEGDRIHILTYSSENLISLNEQGKEIWELLLDNDELTFSELVEICNQEYDAFGDEEVIWLSEFIQELGKLELILLE